MKRRPNPIQCLTLATLAGVRRQRVELLLPLGGGADGEAAGWPGGIRQQFAAARGLVEDTLRALKRAPDLQVAAPLILLAADGWYLSLCVSLCESGARVLAHMRWRTCAGWGLKALVPSGDRACDGAHCPRSLCCALCRVHAAALGCHSMQVSLR